MEEVEKLGKEESDFFLLCRDLSSLLQGIGSGNLLVEDMSICNKKNGEEMESSSDCPSFVVTLQEELRLLPKLSPKKKRCIYRVPKRLRRVKEEAYTPLVVSIGPFHHKKNKRLLPMETLKLKHLESFIRRSEKKGRGGLNTYIKIIKDKERRIRDSYAEDIPMSSDEFVRMILVDSIFIIELFRFKRRIDIMPFINYEEVYDDLSLAENQLPFFILEDLYAAALRPDFLKSFMDIACDVLRVNRSRVEVDPITNEAACLHLLDLLRSHYLPSHQKIDNDRDVDDEDEKMQQRIKARCCHLLNFMRSHYLPFHQNINSGTERDEIGTRRIWCPTTMSLYEAGVKFRVSKKHCSLLDIHFDEEQGILTIPLLQVEDSTEHLHRNLIAFEQCHHYPDQTTYITDYLVFMDCLINTWEDVKLLVEAEIIDNWLGSDKQLSRLINSLNTHVVAKSSGYYYASITKQLRKYRDKRWNRYRATLKHTYFKHPWVVLSVIYAVILLLLTIAQLLTGILAVPGVVKK